MISKRRSQFPRSISWSEGLLLFIMIPTALNHYAFGSYVWSKGLNFALIITLIAWTFRDALFKRSSYVERLGLLIIISISGLICLSTFVLAAPPSWYLIVLFGSLLLAILVDKREAHNARDN